MPFSIISPTVEHENDRVPRVTRRGPAHGLLAGLERLIQGVLRESNKPMLLEARVQDAVCEQDKAAGNR